MHAAASPSTQLRLAQALLLGPVGTEDGQENEKRRTKTNNDYEVSS